MRTRLGRNSGAAAVGRRDNAGFRPPHPLVHESAERGR
jgi:hypothetical protein